MLKAILLIGTILCAYAVNPFEEDDNLVELTEHDFDIILGQGHELWALFFRIPRQRKSEQAAVAFKKASKMMLGLIKFGMINVEENPVLAHRFDARKIPTIVFVDRYGEETKYTEKMDDVEIIDFAGKLLMRQIENGKQKRLSDSKYVKELTGEEMSKNGKNGTQFWMIAFYNSKDNVTRVDFIQMLEYAAEILRGVVNVGAFDITKLSTRYIYDAMPTVVLFHGNRADRYEVEYNDEIFGNKLVDFALARLKTPQIQEVWTEKILTEMCQYKKYCMLAFIPKVKKCDSKCKNNHKNILSEVAEDYKTLPAGWALIRHGVMKNVDKLFHITNDTLFPVFIMIEVKTLKDEYLTDTFKADNIKTMIKQLTEGEGFTGKSIPIFEHLPQYRPWVRDEL